MPFKKDENEMGVLWVKESATGKAFMSGSVICPACAHDQRIVVFSMPEPKKSGKSPDYRILRSQPREGATPVASPAPEPRLVRPVANKDDSDIPF